MNLLNDLTMQQILARIVACLLFMGVHGLVLAGIARAFGNRRPAWDGRLTPNPFVHFTLPALFMSVLFHAAWIRPMRIEPAETRGGRGGVALVALIALALTLAVVPLIDQVRPLAATHMPRTAGYVAIVLLTEAQRLFTVSVVLNLLPLPVLTGRLFLLAAWPRLDRRFRRAEPLAAALLVVVLVAGWWPDVTPLTGYLSRLN